MKKLFKRVLDSSFITYRRYKPTIFSSSYKDSNQSTPKDNYSHDELASSRRNKDSYWANKTAALSLPISSYDLEDKKNNKDELLSISKNLIREHAARRVDLFFYTLIAYYKSNLNIQKGPTDLQHGVGRNTSNNVNVTQACHSSFFGSFIDDAAGNINRTPGRRNSQSILFDTHFSDSLNATVELPAFVNKLDDELEVSCMGRKKSLSILYRVSRGSINPVQGLAEFLKLMSENFNDLENNKQLTPNSPAYLSRKSPEATKTIKNNVIELERTGTLINKWFANTQTVNHEYIELLLRLTPKEKLRCKVSSKARDAVYEEKFDEIKKEILTKKSNQNNGSAYYKI